MACVLAARGRHFDVERFLERTTLTVSRSWKRGQMIGRGRSERKKRHQHSGLTVKVSTHARDELEGQVRDAVAFLKKKAAELKRLRRSGADEVWVEFGVALRQDVAVHADYFPPELVHAASKAGVGVTVSHYPAQS